MEENSCHLGVAVLTTGGERAHRYRIRRERGTNVLEATVLGLGKFGVRFP